MDLVGKKLSHRALHEGAHRMDQEIQLSEHLLGGTKLEQLIEQPRQDPSKATHEKPKLAKVRPFAAWLRCFGPWTGSCLPKGALAHSPR